MASRSAIINVMEKATTDASRRLLRDFGELESLQVTRKGPDEFARRALVNAKSTLYKELEVGRAGWEIHDAPPAPGAPAKTSDEQEDSSCWIIDATDGVFNFLHGIPHFAISVAVMQSDRQGNNSIVAACVNDALRNEFFFSERGQGAYLNERRIRVSGRVALSNALVSSSLPPPPPPGDETGDHDAAKARFGRVAGACGTMRFNGAACLDLAWVAAGRIDGCWHQGLSSAKVAIGGALVREAGGFVTDFTSRDRAVQSGEVVAANSNIHGALLKHLGG